MPLYRFIVPVGATTSEQRATIAADVTRIHCDLTGAPPTFVHVFFVETADPNTAAPHHLHAVHRAGRTPQVKDELLVQARHAPTHLRSASTRTKSPRAWTRPPRSGSWRAAQCCRNRGRKRHGSSSTQITHR